MRLSRMTILAGLTCLVGLSGCSSDLQKTNVLLSRENEDLRAQMAERNAALAENEAAMRDKDNEIARLQQTERPYVQQPLAQVTGFEEIANVTSPLE